MTRVVIAADIGACGTKISTIVDFTVASKLEAHFGNLGQLRGLVFQAARVPGTGCTLDEIEKDVNVFGEVILSDADLIKSPAIVI